MDISVILCTYNRGESLRRTLQSCCTLVIPERVTWELLVVDNNSGDHTRQVCEAFAGKLPLRYLHEPRQGKSYALNTGIACAAGEMLLFTDDDVEVDVRWLTSLWHAAQEHPEVGFFGGKILPLWDHIPPRWVEENLSWLHIHVHLDRGNAEILSTPKAPQIFPGAHLAIRRSVLGSDVRFPENIGPSGSGLTWTGNLRGEECQLEQRLHAQGVLSLYVPEAIVRHWHPAHRSTGKYLRRFFVGMGYAEGLYASSPEGRLWLGAPRWCWRGFLVGLIQYGLSRWTRPSPVWLQAEVAFSRNLGFMLGSRARRKRQ